MGETLESVIQQERERQIVEYGNAAILIDGSLEERPGNSWFLSTYDADHFKEIPSDVLNEIRADHERFITFLRSESVLTTKEVTEELSHYERIVSDKFKFLLLKSRPNPRAESKRNRKPQYNVKERDMPVNCCAEKRESYFAVVTLIQMMMTLSDKRSFKPANQQVYDALFHAVCDIIKCTSAKRTYDYRYEEVTRRHEPLHADESLVAAALYLSVMDDRASAIISKDSDIFRILFEMDRYLRADNVPGKERMDAALSARPIRSYFVCPDGSVILNMDTAQPGHDPAVVAECDQFRTDMVHYIRQRWPMGIFNGAAQTAIR